MGVVIEPFPFCQTTNPQILISHEAPLPPLDSIFPPALTNKPELHGRLNLVPGFKLNVPSTTKNIGVGQPGLEKSSDVNKETVVPAEIKIVSPQIGRPLFHVDEISHFPDAEMDLVVLAFNELKVNRTTIKEKIIFFTMCTDVLSLINNLYLYHML